MHAQDHLTLPAEYHNDDMKHCELHTVTISVCPAAACNSRSLMYRQQVQHTAVYCLKSVSMSTLLLIAAASPCAHVQSNLTPLLPQNEDTAHAADDLHTHRMKKLTMLETVSERPGWMVAPTKAMVGFGCCWQASDSSTCIDSPCS